MGKGRVLKTYDSRAIFENLDTGNCLVITQIKDGWQSKDIQVIDRNQFAECNSGQYLSLSIEAIYGFYDLLSGPYVAVVTESENFLSTNGIEIRKVLKILILPLFRNSRFLSESKQQDEDKYLQLLHESFHLHTFFYSLTSDITATLQRKTKYQLMNKYQNDPLWVRANVKYFWNRDLIHDLITASADEWIQPFMSGYIEYRPGCEIDNDRFSMLFISRRSKMKQGCRFTKRGIDENGYVANFVETEQILIFPDGKITSYVQIRGSIPLLWSSPVHMKWDPIVYIDDDRMKSAEYCHKHIHDINHDNSADHHHQLSSSSSAPTATAGGGGGSSSSNLNSIIFINLIDNKKDQGRLGVEFKEVLDIVSRSNTASTIQLKYIWFDFHAETKKKGKWQNLSKLIKIIDEKNEIFHPKNGGYFCRLSSGEVISWQNNIIRTNCMDNLDRTNVIQSIIARRSLLMQLQRLDLLQSETNILEIPFKKFEIIYKTIWANNANEMSNMYAGTGALKVDFTKTGKRTIQGMVNDGVNACLRYYINNFTDGNKQDGIDLMLGLFKPDPLGPSPFTTTSSSSLPSASISSSSSSSLALRGGVSDEGGGGGRGGGHETLVENVNKMFVFMVLIFTFLLIFSPQLFHYLFSSPSSSRLSSQQVIRYHLLFSMAITVVYVCYILYLMIKKGSKLGERLVVHPVLVPDPVIVQRSQHYQTSMTSTMPTGATGTTTGAGAGAATGGAGGVPMNLSSSNSATQGIKK
jgi:phosphatidylinositol 4-phosphatase